jgi:2-polyprenyl-3-methyl-5-hydroxy-6-metoxy-1,4-benzoquinol methylase
MKQDTIPKYSKRYYNLSSEKKGQIFKRYMNFIDKLGIRFDNLNICDIGCAKGSFYNALKMKVKYFGYDISEYAIKYCRKRFSSQNATFKQLDLNTQHFEKKTKFDIITMFDVIEHLDSFVNIKKIIDVNLREGGFLVITTPNANSFTRFFNKAINFTGEIDSTHTILFTPYTLDFFLRKSGLTKVCLSTPYFFYFRNNQVTKHILFGGQIFAIYRKQ